MTITEIKKELYKQKPLAKFEHCMKDARGLHLLYSSKIIDPFDKRYEPHAEVVKDLFFRVPADDIGDGIFEATIEAPLLIRYIVEPKITQP